MSDLDHELLSTIHTLDICIWHRKINSEKIEEWLRGFNRNGLDHTEIRSHALFLLSKFMYFGDYEVRALLKALFREYVRRPLIAESRAAFGGSRDRDTLNVGVNARLQHVRFLGLGNPSESGVHLLYHYRQENRLAKNWFINFHEILDLTGNEPKIANHSIRRYIFLDDFCGSGEQANRYSHNISVLRQIAKRDGVNMTIAYHVLVGTQKGLARVRALGIFDEVECIIELGSSYRAFGADSRYFVNAPDTIKLRTAEHVAHSSGTKLVPGAPLGFDNGQLMLGFVHNTPDNTLPIFWHEGTDSAPWTPVFPRYPKI